MVPRVPTVPDVPVVRVTSFMFQAFRIEMTTPPTQTGVNYNVLCLTFLT